MGACMLDIAFAKAALPKNGALVLFLAPDETPSGLVEAADKATGGAITRAISIASFKAEHGKSLNLLAPGAGLSRIVLIGLGKDVPTQTSLEEAGGAAWPAIAKENTAAIAAPTLSKEQIAFIAHGATLRSYRFDRYRTDEKADAKPTLTKLTVLTTDPASTRAALAPLRAIAEGVFLTRDLVSEPANVLYPAEFAERCRKLTTLGLKVEILGPKELAKLGFGALLGVAQGSEREARVVTMHWNGAGTRSKEKPVCFIGKGVTFDTGGISIKPAAGMEDMKWDMGGAGTVTGLMAALAARKAKVNAIGIIGLVENMPSGTAQRPGDVVTSYSGQTIEVINTDAEGRLVLADVLWYAQQKYDPRVMIDLATLTGAIIIGLGHEYAGLFSNDDALAEQIAKAGGATGEKVWRMPMHPAYDRQIRSDIADVKNVGGRPAGSITAAQFLQRFVNGKPWAHLDIAGMAWLTHDTSLAEKGAAGYGVRLLDRLVAEYYEG
ncbi:Cytosol aminopeptidase [Granulibacter bethesdensis]|nr:Cytosol aminopeptidase [Granulibacter bethesdensis]